MNTISDLAMYLADVRNEFNLFSLQEASACCQVTEMTIRNFEAGKTVNPKVLVFYLKAVKSAYDNGMQFSNGKSYSELMATEPQEVAVWCEYFTMKTLNSIIKAMF